MNPRVLNAPHCYLTRKQDNIYNLFVIVPTNGSAVEYEPPKLTNRCLKIVGKLTNSKGTGNEIKYNTFHREIRLGEDYLDTEVFKDGEQVEVRKPNGIRDIVDEEDKDPIVEICVRIKNGAGRKSVKLDPTDSDEIDVGSTPIAMDCPYLYLFGKNKKALKPSLIIPSKNFDLQREEISIFSGPKGGGRSKVVLIKRDESRKNAEFISPPDTNCVQYHVDNRVPLRGDFRVNISRIASPEEEYSTTEVRNKNSDL